MRGAVLLLATLAAACAPLLAAAQAPSPGPLMAPVEQPILPSTVYYAREYSGEEAVVAPATSVGPPAPPMIIGAPYDTADSVEQCSALCRNASACDLWEWCGREVRARLGHSAWGGPQPPLAPPPPGASTHQPSTRAAAPPPLLHPQDGCFNGLDETLAYKACSLRGESCSLPALARGRDQGVKITSGGCCCHGQQRCAARRLVPAWPLRLSHARPPAERCHPPRPARSHSHSLAHPRTPGFPLRTTVDGYDGMFVELRGQGMTGGDMECPDVTTVPGICAIDGPPEQALLLCLAMAPQCRAAVTYLNGTAACSPTTTTLLKGTAPTPESA